ESGFVGYIKDQYTTLPEATDRILATSIKANWQYANADSAIGNSWSGIRQTIIETFAEHNSLSVQHTLYAMGEAVLEKFPSIAEISFSLPNIHYLPVDLARLGLENGNLIFLPTDEPHGLIEARLSR
ncbi:MAG: urate oxidase, partial [Acidobacteriota bacterium]|nr:urate oxidase [Acidobacteriota bacterium]